MTRLLAGLRAIVYVAGFVLLWGWLAVNARRPAPFDPPRQFVAVGPYRWVRNPMYVGGVSVLVGVGMWQRSPGILLLALVGMLAAHLFVTLVEEPGLARRFGDSYREYTRTVGRWLPKWP